MSMEVNGQRAVRWLQHSLAPRWERFSLVMDWRVSTLEWCVFRGGPDLPIQVCSALAGLLVSRFERYGRAAPLSVGLRPPAPGQ
jgi:hypothetical protein